MRRREAREPVAYIRGRRAFRTIELERHASVLIPRPETETLVEVALEALAAAPAFAAPGKPRVARRRHGLGLHRARARGRGPVRRVVAIDVDEAAVGRGAPQRGAPRAGRPRRACCAATSSPALPARPPLRPDRQQPAVRARRRVRARSSRTCATTSRGSRCTPATTGSMSTAGSSRRPPSGSSPAARWPSRSAAGQAAAVTKLLVAAAALRAGMRARRPGRRRRAWSGAASEAVVVRYEKVRAVVLGSRPLGEADRIAAPVHPRAGTRGRGGQGRAQDDLALGRPPRALQRQRPDAVPRALALHRDPGAARRRASGGCARTARRSRRRRCVCEAAAGLFPEHEPEERVYALLRNAPARARRRASRARRSVGAAAARRAAQAPVRGRLSAGARPLRRLRRRPACALGFSAARGGLVCEGCLDEAVPITPEAVDALVPAGSPSRSPCCARRPLRRPWKRRCATCTASTRTTAAPGCGRSTTCAHRLAGRRRPGARRHGGAGL